MDRHKYHFWGQSVWDKITPSSKSDPNIPKNEKYRIDGKKYKILHDTAVQNNAGNQILEEIWDPDETDPPKYTQKSTKSLQNTNQKCDGMTKYDKDNQKMSDNKTLHDKNKCTE